MPIRALCIPQFTHEDELVMDTFVIWLQKKVLSINIKQTSE